MGVEAVVEGGCEGQYRTDAIDYGVVWCNQSPVTQYGSDTISLDMRQVFMYTNLPTINDISKGPACNNGDYSRVRNRQSAQHCIMNGTPNGR